tara:strand:- start:4844 stop:5797 length:954 start_codon:yes stop_codon:yes gene_type:complete
MPKPIKWNGSASLKEMSAAEIDDNVDLILDHFSGMTSDNTGHLAMNAEAGWTDIGTFADTRRDQAQGTHPANTTIHTDNYVFRQNLTDVTPSPTARPFAVKYDSGSYDGLIEMTDAECRADIVDRINIKIAAGGVGSYVLQVAAPETGTWTSIATINNKLAVDTVANSTQLWKRTTGSNTTATRPIKWNSNQLKEMSDAEINDLVEMYQESIVDTGIGKYVLQAAAPGSGTWQTVGDAFSDTRKQRTDQDYSGPYTGVYSGTYTGYYSTYYSGRQVGPYTGNYTGNYTGYYTGTYTGATIMAAVDTVSTLKLWLRTA